MIPYSRIITWESKVLSQITRLTYIKICIEGCSITKRETLMYVIDWLIETYNMFSSVIHVNHQQINKNNIPTNSK